MHAPKTVVVSVAAFALLGLTACGSSGSSGTTTSSTAPAATSSALGADVAWAESVCQRADELDASVAAVATSVSVDPSAGDVLDQLQKQLGAAVDTVKGDVVDLAGAIAAVPKGSDPAVTAAADQLTQDKAALESSVQSLQTAGTTFADADGVLAKVTAFGAVTTAAGQVKDAATTFAASLKATTSAGGDAAKAAFAAAPTCQKRAAG